MILILVAELLVTKDYLADSQSILQQEHLTDDDLLLELVLANMRNDTQFFNSRLQREKKEKKQYLMKK